MSNGMHIRRTNLTSVPYYFIGRVLTRCKWKVRYAKLECDALKRALIEHYKFRSLPLFFLFIIVSWNPSWFRCVGLDNRLFDLVLVFFFVKICPPVYRWTMDALILVMYVGIAFVCFFVYYFLGSSGFKFGKKKLFNEMNIEYWVMSIVEWKWKARYYWKFMVINRRYNFRYLSVSVEFSNRVCVRAFALGVLRHVNECPNWIKMREGWEMSSGQTHIMCRVRSSEWNVRMDKRVCVQCRIKVIVKGSGGVGNGLPVVLCPVVHRVVWPWVTW